MIELKVKYLKLSNSAVKLIKPERSSNFVLCKCTTYSQQKIKTMFIDGNNKPAKETGTRI